MVSKLTKSGLDGLKSGGATEALLEGVDVIARERAPAFGHDACGRSKGVVDQIGLGLRTAYNDVLSQPVPDRFFELLRQLETSGVQGKKDAQ